MRLHIARLITASLALTTKVKKSEVYANKTGIGFTLCSHVSGLFKIESETGRLTVTRSLDRERKDMYNIKVKTENVIHRRVGRDTSSQKSHESDFSNYHLAFDEALVVVYVTDVSDAGNFFVQIAEHYHNNHTKFDNNNTCMPFCRRTTTRPFGKISKDL